MLFHIRDVRREFITQKYIHRKYIEHQLESTLLNQELVDAVELRDIRHLLQVCVHSIIQLCVHLLGIC